MTWQEKRDRFLLRFGALGLAILLGVWVIAGRSPDPQLLIVFAGLVGLPQVLPKKGAPP